ASPNVASRLHKQPRVVSAFQASLLAMPANARASENIRQAAGAEFLQAVSTVSGISTTVLETGKVELPWLRESPSSAMARPSDVFVSFISISPRYFAPSIRFDFCIPPNPILNALRLRAEANLHKIRTCRNIAGLKRQLDPYAAPTDTVSGLPTIGAGGQLILSGTSVIRPSLYRYATLIERAKQLVQLAAQIEAAMFSTIEKRDAEAYTLLKARQEFNL